MLSSKFCSLHMSPSSFFQLFHFIAFHHFIALLRRAASFYSKRVVIIPSTLFYSSLDVNSKLGYKETKTRERSHLRRRVRHLAVVVILSIFPSSCHIYSFQFPSVLHPIHLLPLQFLQFAQFGLESQLPSPSPSRHQISSHSSFPCTSSHPFCYHSPFSLTTRRFSRILLYQLRSRSTPPQHSLRLSSRVSQRACRSIYGPTSGIETLRGTGLSPPTIFAFVFEEEDDEDTRVLLVRASRSKRHVHSSFKTSSIRSFPRRSRK